MLLPMLMAGQALSDGGASRAVKPDNMPLSQLYMPGTTVVPLAKRRELYAEASAAYMQEFAREPEYHLSRLRGAPLKNES